MSELDPPVTHNETLKERWASYAEEEPLLVELRSRLLAIGGEEVVPAQEPDLSTLLSSGRVIEPTGVITASGAPSQCHQNAARLHEDEESITEIGTGWALSSDGLWRQHSWAHRGDELVETTEPRVTYFGILLAGEAADAFVSQNYY